MVSDSQHTAHEVYDFRIKYNEELNEPTVQPENGAIRLVFASIALIEHIQCKQVETLYILQGPLKRHFAPNKVVLGAN